MKTQLTCKTCEPELSAYVDGALHPAVARVLEAHVAACPSCRVKLDAYRAIAAGLAELPELEAPAWLEARIVARVTRPARWMRALRGGFATAGALSFALFIGFIAFLPQLARQWGLPEPATWPVHVARGTLDAVVRFVRHLSLEVAFWEPIGRPIWSAIHALGTLPRVAWVALQTGEAQAALAIAFTVGIALFFVLRPSRTREGGVGHACLSL